MESSPCSRVAPFMKKGSRFSRFAKSVCRPRTPFPLCRPAIDAHKHQLKVELPPHPIWLDADQTRMEQVVVNLLRCPFSEPRMRVSMRVATLPSLSLISATQVPPFIQAMSSSGLGAAFASACLAGLESAD